MEAEIEVSKPELYYIAKYSPREHGKGIVCGIIVIDIENVEQIRRVSAKSFWQLAGYLFEDRVKMLHVAISDRHSDLFHVHIFVF